MFCLIQEYVSNFKCINKLLLHESMEVHDKSMHVNEFLSCHHSNENSLAVLSCSIIRFSVNYKMKFGNFVEFRLCFLSTVPIHKF